MLTVRIVKALTDFTLDISWESRGRVVALVGPSGSGKTLTLDCLAGLMRPDRGRLALDERVLFDHESRVDEPPQRRRLGYVFQGYALFPHLTVRQNVSYGVQGRPDEARRARVDLVLDRLDIASLAAKLPGELSGGQQQRVALARALAIDPALLLLDEPLSALDVPLRRELRRDLARTIREWQKTTVLVTHDLAEAYEMADDVVIYDEGAIVAAAPKADLLWQPTSRRVASLIGIRNVLSGRIEGSTADVTRIRWRGVTLSALNSAAHPVALREGSPLSFFVRPEYVRLLRKDEPVRDQHANAAVIDGEIVDERDEGTRWVLSFRVATPGPPSQGGHDLEIDVPKLVYERLDIGRERRWQVVIQPSSIQILPSQ